MEKSYRMWGQDLSREYSLFEAGMDRFIDLDKAFTGRDALIKQQESGIPRRLVTLEISNIEDADPLGNEPLWREGKIVGRATAGAHGHFIDRTLALAYVEAGFNDLGTEVEIEILGNHYPAVVIPDSPHDPQNLRLRA